LYKTHKVKWEFEIEVGKNYYDRSLVTNIDQDTIEIKGSYLSISDIMKELDRGRIDYEVVKYLEGDLLINKETNLGQTNTGITGYVVYWRRE
jgi:hypothetical protein